MRIRRKRAARPVWIVIAAVLILAVVMWFLAAVGNIGGGSEEESRLHLESALRRAAVACYAAEGVYPPSVEYITEHYGVQINSERYTVFYEVFAENLMPEITVTETGE
ncbi:MAG: hypothetical protein IJP23_01510 [Oscillospiraceae bacterium]|nr:hypothetical protein [Oscillospiraceae bacterium]